MKSFVGLAIGVLLAVAVLIVNHFCYGMRFDSDSAGVLISALGVMVTALVGWQVFNAIENTKTLKKLEDLETNLNLQINLSERRNQELFDIAEAHRLEQEAVRTTDEGYRYSCYLRALLLYIKSNVSFEYPPLQNKIAQLNTIIKRVERATDEDIKILFARQMGDWEQWHEELLDVITGREEELRRTRREVINLRAKRERLFQQYVGMETSVDKQLRETLSSAQNTSENP